MNCDSREIRAGFDQEGIFIFQAFRPAAAEWAVKNQKFGFGFSLKRFTWIKPSFGWMLYRSNFASKEGQKKILRIKIHHAAFLFILENSIPAIYDPVLQSLVIYLKHLLDFSDFRKVEKRGWRSKVLSLKD